MPVNRVWVITAQIIEASAFGRAAERGIADRSLERVLMLLPSNYTARDVKDMLRRLNSFFWHTLGESRAELGARGRDRDLRHEFINMHTDVVIMLMHGQTHLQAHKSTIRRIEETDNGEYLVYQPDSYTVPQIDPATHHILRLDQHEFAERRVKKVELDYEELLMS